MSAKMFFQYQLGLIKASFDTNTVLLRDFNIDAAKKYETHHPNKDLFDDSDLALGELDLNQLISFETCSRVINNVRKFSTLDHIWTECHSEYATTKL